MVLFQEFLSYRLERWHAYGLVSIGPMIDGPKKGDDSVCCTECNLLLWIWLCCDSVYLCCCGFVGVN